VCTFEVPILREEDSATSCTSVQKGLVEYSLKGVCLDLNMHAVGEEDLLTREVPSLKNSSYKGPKRRSNFCCDGTVVSAEGETFCSSGAGSRWKGFKTIRPPPLGSLVVTSATKDVKHAVANASAQKNKGSLEAESIIRAALTRVRFRLSTTPFCQVVRGLQFDCSFPSSLKNALSVLFKNSVPLSVRTEITGA
ncbi:hypothetical protein Tco_0693989, partial [Tanacetum coccineum]